VPAAASKTAAPTPAPAVAKPSRWPLIVITILLLALGSAGTGWYLTARSTAVDGAEPVVAAKPILPAPALYYALDPAFVVNLNNTGFEGPRYLQVEVQLMTRDPLVHAALAQHTPALRARLLLLFDQLSAADIADRAGKEHLREQALTEVRHLIQAETGSDAIESLLFTSFVTQ